MRKLDGVLEKNSNYVPETRTLDNYAEDACSLALRLIKKDPSVRLWFSFPTLIQVNIADYYTLPYEEKIIKGVKEKLDVINPNIWADNVIGFYYSHEDVPNWYTSFDIKNNAFVKTNPVVKSMNHLSNTLHNQYGKMFLWIPYLGEAPENVKRIGYIANAVNIFDYVIVQPTRLFDGSGYISSGTGNDVINIDNKQSFAGDDISVRIHCPSAESLSIVVRGNDNGIIFTKSEMGNVSDFTFRANQGLHTITVMTLEGKKANTYNKAVFVDAKEKWQDNIKTILNSSRKSNQYYPGNTGFDGEAVTKKISKTKLGFEMEIDGFCVANPESIVYKYPTILKDSSYDPLRYTFIEAEMTNYLKYIANKRKEWFNEYMDVFYKFRKRYPVAFYAGERNELFEGINDAITVSTDNVFKNVAKFFKR